MRIYIKYTASLHEPKTAHVTIGNLQMLESAVAAAGMDGVFHHILSVDAVKKYKTAPEAYQLAPDVFGLSAKSILFVSSNGWDICGAAWFGYSTFWVNRQGGPLEELGVVPAASGADMSALLNFIKKKAETNK